MSYKSIFQDCRDVIDWIHLHVIAFESLRNMHQVITSPVIMTIIEFQGDMKSIILESVDEYVHKDSRLSIILNRSVVWFTSGFIFWCFNCNCCLMLFFICCCCCLISGWSSLVPKCFSWRTVITPTQVYVFHFALRSVLQTWQISSWIVMMIPCLKKSFITINHYSIPFFILILLLFTLYSGYESWIGISSNWGTFH